MNIDKELAGLQAKAETLIEEIRTLARGTRDVTPAAGAAVAGAPPAVAVPAVSPPTVPPASFAERITAELRRRPLSIEQLAQHVQASTGRVSTALRPLRKALWNAGTETDPRWFLPPGDDASPEAFAAAVTALVRIRPMTTAELCRATRTEGSKRVWHALLRLNDAPASRLVRQGDPRRPSWFWLDEAVDVSRLTARR